MADPIWRIKNENIFKNVSIFIKLCKQGFVGTLISNTTLKLQKKNKMADQIWRIKNKNISKNVSIFKKLCKQWFVGTLNPIPT